MFVIFKMSPVLSWDECRPPKKQQNKSKKTTTSCSFLQSDYRANKQKHCLINSLVIFTSNLSRIFATMSSLPPFSVITEITLALWSPSQKQTRHSSHTYGFINETDC